MESSQLLQFGSTTVIDILDTNLNPTKEEVLVILKKVIPKSLLNVTNERAAILVTDLWLSFIFFRTTLVRGKGFHITASYQRGNHGTLNR